MPGYQQLGRFSTFFGEGNFTDASFRVVFDGNELAEVDARVSAILFGYYWQSHTLRGGVGYSWGVRTAMRREGRSSPASFAAAAPSGRPTASGARTAPPTA